MPPILFAHPFSSHCQKVLVALYENATAFTFRMLDHADTATFAEFAELWPLKRFPLLLDDGRPIVEATRTCRPALSRPGAADPGRSD